MTDRAESAESEFWGEVDETGALQRYRTLVNSIDDGIYQLDGEGRFVAVNDVIVETTGYARHELLGEHLSVLLDDAGVSAIEREIERLRVDPAARGELLELTVHTAAGDRIDWEVRVSLLDGGDAMRGAVGIVRDITDRHRPGQGVSERDREHEVWSAAMEESIDGMAILDENAEYVYVNQAHAEMYGYDDPSALLGETWEFCYDDAEVDHLEAEAMPALSAEGSWRGEATGTRKDGSTFPQELSLTVLDDGRHICVVRDLTEQTRREQNLRKTEEQLTVATEAASVGSWTWDIREDVVTADSYLAESYGMDPEEAAAGAPMAEFYDPIHEDDEEETWEQLQQAVEETGELETEYRVRGADGELMWVEARGEVQYDDGEPIRMYGAVSDITDRKRREQLLVEQTGLLERIASDAPLEACLSALCDAVSRLNSSVRASILLADDERDAVEQAIAPDFPPSWREGLEGARIDDLAVGTCATAVFRGEPTTCEDVANDEKWATDWRETCLDHGVLAGHSEPIRDADGTPAGSFMLCFDEPREPNEWERRLADFGTHVAGIAVERERSRQALREREARLRTLVETVPECIKVVDADGTLRQMNPAGLDLVQAESASSVVGESVYDLIAPEYREEFREFNEWVCQGNSGTLQFDIVGLAGERRHMESHAAPLRRPDGTVSQLALTRDVTERTQRERKIEESERRNRALVENFPNGAVALVDRDLGYQIVGGTPIDDNATTDMEGRSIREAVSADLADVLEPKYRTALDGERNTFEYEHGGNHFRVHTFPVRDSDGDVFAAMGMSQDITEQVERERALEDAKSQLEAAAEAGAIGTWEWHIPEDRFVAGASFAREFGVDPEAARDGVSLDRFVSSIHEADRERVEAKIEDAVESCGEYQAEYRVWNADGDLRWVVARGQVECDEDGDPMTFPGAVTDITERKQFEQQLEESNERLEQFAYAASHDLQEPLRMVTSYLQLVERRYGDQLDEDGREFIEFAVDGAERMREMIEGLLQYSRVDTRGDPFEPVDLDDVLADVRNDLQMTIEESDADIDVASLPRVEGDAGQLRQVFQNLLDNAIEYAGDDPPRIRVSAERDGNQWVVSVSDDGIGIDPDDADRVFEVFQSLHTNDEHAGTGIGLALCERIVERHGGEIWIDSEPGEGSTFSFTLPATGEPSE